MHKIIAAQHNIYYIIQYILFTEVAFIIHLTRYICGGTFSLHGFRIAHLNDCGPKFMHASLMDKSNGICLN